MMRYLLLALIPLTLLALAGCESMQMGSSGDKAKACNYCPETKMLAGYEGTVHCDACNKDFPAGKYCAKCNRFMLPGTVHCDKCNKDMPKGAYCAACKKYVGVPGMTYDEAKGEPVGATGVRAGPEVATSGVLDRRLARGNVRLGGRTLRETR